MVTRRDFLRIAGMGTAAVAFPQLLSAKERKPNVIVILSDDHGYADVGCQGCADVQTPSIDSIAKNGIRFTNGYVSCPVCSPTRAGLMTGRYQQRFGHEHNPTKDLDRKNWGLPLDQKTIAQYMQDQGYATACIGKWHLGDVAPYHPNKRGFDEFFGFIGGAHPYLDPTLKMFNMIQRNGKPEDPKEHLTYAFAREAVSFIERHKDKPFFLYLPFNAVHQPLEPPIRMEKDFPEIKDEKRRRFARLLKSMDDSIGSILAKVWEAGLENDTLIIFLSDNGGPTDGNTSRNDPFKGYKTQVWEGGVHVPFMMQWKGHLPAGKVYDKPVISLDILPTAVSVAGGKAASDVEGVDLIPYLGGDKSGSPHHALYWRYEQQSAVRMGDWKLARHEVHGTRLYNLAEDPGEKNDLAVKYPEKVKSLQEAWDEWNSKNIPSLWASGTQAPWTESGW